MVSYWASRHVLKKYLTKPISRDGGTAIMTTIVNDIRGLLINTAVEIIRITETHFIRGNRGIRKRACDPTIKTFGLNGFQTF